MLKNPLHTLRRHTAATLLALTGLAAATGLTGCGVDYSWNPTPPPGWSSTFYDSDLNGYWRLVEVNSQYVSSYDTNFLYFNGDGRGVYYYYSNGRRYWENTAYWCQRAYGGTSSYQINIQYESSGAPTTMNYWFTDRGDILWMQWRNEYGLQTYVYSYQPYAPW